MHYSQNARPQPSPAFLLSTRVRWLVWGGLACLVACGDAPPQGGAGAPLDGDATSIDLLARKPDLSIEQAGRLVLHAKDHWEDNALTGWYPLTIPPAEGRPAAAEFGHEAASVRLTSTLPVERTVRLTAWVPNPDPASPHTLEVLLNGISLGNDLTLESEPRELTLLAPRSAWKLGENELELRVPVFASARSGAAIFDRVRVASISWGPEQRVVQQEHSLLLSGGTGLSYDLEPLGTPRLHLRGEAEGAGELQLRYELVDPALGKPDGPEVPPRLLPLADGAVELDLPTPMRGDRVLRLQLLWRSDDPASTLRLDSGTLEGCDPAPRPPIIFISIDTFSARHMAVYGYDRLTTPNLEALLGESVLFERCVANAPWTTPSYLSVLSGLFPRAHQIDPEGPGTASLFDQWQMAENRWTLAESLRARGYSTAGFVDTTWLDERFRVHQGFDVWDDAAADLPATHPDYGVAYVTEMARRWLTALPAGQSPFLFLHALDAHGPYLPELPYLGTFQDDLPTEPRMALAGADYQAAGAMPEWMAKTILHGVDMITPEELRVGKVPKHIAVDPVIARYDEALLKVDAYVGRFLDAVRAQGIWDDAVVIVTGDHGEAFEEEYYGHARLYESVLEVPLIIKLPHGRGAGRRVSTGVQLVDLYPTLMELTSGRPAPAWLHGRSLVPLIDGKTLPSQPLFSEGGHFEAYTILVDHWKLVESYPSRESGAAALISHPRTPVDFVEREFPELVGEPLTPALILSFQQDPEFPRRIQDLRQLLAAQEPFLDLFDLEQDPGETTNLAQSQPQKVRELLEQLQEFKRAARDAQATAQRGITAPDLSAEQIAELVRLGYISEE